MMEFDFGWQSEKYFVDFGAEGEIYYGMRQ
jgi:hypothetical protein